MEEKRKELMQLIISMTDEEHLDSLLERGLYRALRAISTTGMIWWIASWMRFRNALTRIFRESWHSLTTAARNSDKGKKRGRRVCVVPFGYLVFCAASSSSSFSPFAVPSK